MTLNYNTYTYTPTRDELKKFFKHELSKQEIAQEYIDNYYADETTDGLAELADMYPEGTTVKSIENDADGWILDILVDNIDDYYADDNWRELMLDYFSDKAYKDYYM